MSKSEFTINVPAEVLAELVKDEKDGMIDRWKGVAYKSFVPYIKKELPTFEDSGVTVAQSMRSVYVAGSEWQRQTICCGHGDGYLCIQYQRSHYRRGEGLTFHCYWTKNSVCQKCEYLLYFIRL